DRYIDQCIDQVASLGAAREQPGAAAGREDPLIHAYERFLTVYDGARRRRRGVFFTPLPAARYVVRGAHALLERTLGVTGGLCSTATRAEVLGAGAERPGDPFVQIIDPAAGAGTFLIECVRLCERELKARWAAEAAADEVARRWRVYAPRSLLPRLVGFEIMPVACALARLRLALLLRETGCARVPGGALRVYTTNSLAPAGPGEDPDDVSKRDGRFAVVVGNPPYANYGARTQNELVRALLAPYKRGLRERKHNLDDEYVKFMGLAQRWVEDAGAGVLGLVTNNAYVTGITHRRLRASLRASFDRVRVLDLHGDARRPPDAGAACDENVFAIRQGVAVLHAARRPGATSSRAAEVLTRALVGSRERKLEALERAGAEDQGWTRALPRDPYQFFSARALPREDEFHRYLGLKEIFAVSGNGVKTERDRVAIQLSRAAIERVVADFRALDESTLRGRYGLAADSRDWSVARARADVLARRGASRVRPLLYRPYDLRFTWYSGQARGFIGTPARPTMRHMLVENLALVTTRQTADPFGVFCTRALVGHKSVARHDINSAFPLYRVDESGTRRSNVTPAFTEGLAAALGLEVVTPEDAFRYIYALLHGETYRRRYQALLRVEFPRIPWPRAPALLAALTRLGAALIELHAGDNAALAERGPDYVGDGPAIVERVRYCERRETVWIDRAASRGFSPISRALWETRVGGYQVLRRWLRERGPRAGRPGLELDGAAITRYRAIAAALVQSEELRAAIDREIASAGPWTEVFCGRAGDDADL
ncbi:MAG: N-6 DNA methylase, partial [Myxococcales bacterium]|nr:N-6 DNA methylase [Myxococcales bacterium]